MIYIFNKSLVLVMTLAITSCNFLTSKNDIELFPVQIDGKYQYIDGEGKIIITPQFSEASVFREGLALVKLYGENQKYGYIDEFGKFVISPNYLSASVFSEGKAWVVTNNSAPSAIDAKGNILFTLQDAESVNNFHENLAAYSTIINGEIKWGFVDENGKVVITPQFYDTRKFSNSMCAVQNKEGLWGYIDIKGNVKINYQFKLAGDYVNNNAVVYNSSDKGGLIDNEGKYVINPQFDFLIIDDNKILISQNNKYGWVDMNGKYIINPQFENASPFVHNDLTSVQIGEKFGYIDLKGKVVIDPQFERAYPFNGEFAVIVSGGKFGLINKEGKFVVNPQYDGISDDLSSFLYNYYNEINNIETIESNYVNFKIITDAINVTSPNGLPIFSSLSKVMEKFNKTLSDISQYTYIHSLVYNKNITSNISYGLNMYVNAYRDVADGWYTKKVINEFAQIKGYIFTFTLSGKRYSGKAYDLKTALEKTYTGYNNSVEESTPKVSVYKKNNIIIKTCATQNEVYVFIIDANDITLVQEVSYAISSMSYLLVSSSKNYGEIDAATEKAIADSIAAAQADSISNAASMAADTAAVMYIE